MPLDALYREVSLHYKLEHPNVIRLFHVMEDENYLYMVLELAQSGTLFHTIRMESKLSEQKAWEYFTQICLAVYYLHQHSIIHRDIKPENILLSQNSVKICDFGWSTQSDLPRHTFCGTLDYMPPEMLEAKAYDKMIDIWALGVLLYEMLHGRAPFGGTENEKRSKILQAQLEFDKHVSTSARNLIEKLMKKNPKERLDTKGILKHPWINKFSIANKVAAGTEAKHKTLGKCVILEVYGLIATIKLTDSDKQQEAIFYDLEFPSSESDQPQSPHLNSLESKHSMLQYTPPNKSDSFLNEKPDKITRGMSMLDTSSSYKDSVLQLDSTPETPYEDVEVDNFYEEGSGLFENSKELNQLKQSRQEFQEKIAAAKLGVPVIERVREAKKPISSSKRGKIEFDDSLDLSEACALKRKLEFERLSYKLEGINKSLQPKQERPSLPPRPTISESQPAHKEKKSGGFFTMFGRIIGCADRG